MEQSENYVKFVFDHATVDDENNFKDALSRKINLDGQNINVYDTDLAKSEGQDFTGEVSFEGKVHFLDSVYVEHRFNLEPEITPAQITSTQHNYSPTGLANAINLRLSSDASRSITGIALPDAGQILTIHNIGSFNIILENEDAGSTAANRFSFNTDITLFPNQSCMLWYDSTSFRWRLVSIANSVTEDARKRPRLITDLIDDTSQGSAPYAGNAVSSGTNSVIASDANHPGVIRATSSTTA